MATPSEISRQNQLEREAISFGKQKLQNSLKELAEKSYSSASVYGVASIRECLPSVIQEVATSRLKIQKGRAGYCYTAVAEHLDNLEDLAIASIALKCIFDQVFSTKRGADTLHNVTYVIGKSLEEECKFRWYEEWYPGLMSYIRKTHFHSSTGTRQKVTSTQTVMGHCDVHWDRWRPEHIRQLGAWCVKVVSEVTGWFEVSSRNTSRKQLKVLIPTDLFNKTRSAIMEQAELFSGIPWPMLVEPNDWSNEKLGGYYINRLMNGFPLTRRVKCHLIHGELPISFLNKLQKVRYRVSNHVLDVAHYCKDKEIKVGKFIPIVPAYKPPKPPDIGENVEATKRWKRETRDAHNTDRLNFKKSVRTRIQLEAADKFKDDVFYLCWSFDYRGRAYPIQSFLTPQDTDFGKSLIRFTDESPVTEEATKWLAFQVATTYGKDKDTFVDRLKWVYNNTELITRVALDPTGNITQWENAEEPWQFMAACHEYYHCCILKDHHHTGLMVAVDATCSGLQILAGLAKDQSTAELVNVAPGIAPSDAYKAVANEAKKYLPTRMHSWMTRKTTKRTVMTIPYNATKDSSRKYIKEALIEQGINPTKDELTEVVNAVYQSMDAIVPGPMQVMRWIKKHVGNYIRNGATQVEWVTPSGFVVNQQRNKLNLQRIRLQLLGNVSVQMDDGHGDPCPQRHQSSTAPNFIHSLDASLLHCSFQQFNGKPFTVIHDSVLARASDMGTLNTLVRETYTRIFTEDCWLTRFGEVIQATEPPPIVGTLDPTVVKNSTYFFC